MAIIGGRAHSMEEIHAVGELGYPHAEISLYVPDQVEAELGQLRELKSRYGLNYLAHFPNEGNPFDLEKLKKAFLPRMKRLFELAAELGITKGTFHCWIDSRWIAPDTAREKIVSGPQISTASRARVIPVKSSASARSRSRPGLRERLSTPRRITVWKSMPFALWTVDRVSRGRVMS